jgi:hypothetical protein
MAKRMKSAERRTKRPRPVKLTASEVLERMARFEERKEHFIAAVRRARIEVYLPDQDKTEKHAVARSARKGIHTHLRRGYDSSRP